MGVSLFVKSNPVFDASSVSNKVGADTLLFDLHAEKKRKIENEKKIKVWLRLNIMGRIVLLFL